MNGKAGGASFGFTNDRLKMIALVTMVIDHTGLLFDGFLGADLLFLRVIGRVSFPIFAFLIAEGCRHTSNIKRYMLRLLAFAVLSHLCMMGVVAVADAYGFADLFRGFGAYNVFFTLLLGAVSVAGYKQIRAWLPNPWFLPIALLPWFAAAGAAAFFGTDYGFAGVTLIFLSAVADAPVRAWPRASENQARTGVIARVARLLAVFVCICMIYCLQLMLPLSFSNLHSLMPYAALVSVPLIAFYNGRLGKRRKWFYYAAYPGHLALLGLLWLLLTALVGA